MADYEQFASGEGRRILVVDDDEAVLKGLSDYFTRLGYEVIRAGTGKQGLDGFRSQSPDVTILDLRLPDIDGMQILEIMREKKALVILLTGYGDIPTAVRAMQLGAENFLTKPVDLPHLVATVERAIEKLDLRRENVRLRQMVPSTRKRVAQLIAVVILAAASLLVGRWVGAMGNATPVLAPIAPIHTSGMGNGAAPARRDSVRPPAAKPPSEAAPRR
ncbi:MAG TPA: response regulator [Gemmatimonadales bacterium]|nr:response regulator [Gemmatimonadales bacterium]